MIGTHDTTAAKTSNFHPNVTNYFSTILRTGTRSPTMAQPILLRKKWHYPAQGTPWSEIEDESYLEGLQHQAKPIDKFRFGSYAEPAHRLCWIPDGCVDIANPRFGESHF